MSSLEGPSAVVLWALHPDLLGAEDRRMDPTHLEDLSNRETAGIARRQVIAQLLGMHLEVDTALCHDGPATTASTTPSLHAAAGVSGSNPSVDCPLRGFCPTQSPFIIVVRGRYIHLLYFTTLLHLKPQHQLLCLNEFTIWWFTDYSYQFPKQQGQAFFIWERC